MKTIKLKLEYGIPEASKDKAETLTCDYMLSAINMKYKDGMEGQLRRIFGRLQRKCDEAVDKGYDILELEETEFELVKDCFEDSKFPPVLSKYVNILEDELERASKA